MDEYYGGNGVMGAYAGITTSWIDNNTNKWYGIITGGIVTDGLVLALDAGVSRSYPGSGTTWTDLSGSGNNGTLVNGVGYSGDNLGSLSFDGVNDYGRINSFSADSNLAFSVFCWVYPKNLTVDQFGGNYLNWIINKRNITEPNSNSWQFNTSNSYPVVAIWDNNNTAIHPSQTSSASAFELNKWYYTGFTTDGTNNGSLKIYINDSVNFSGTLTGNRGIETKPIDIGKTGWSDSFFWNGNIAQVSIYNRALSAAEVSQNFNALKSRFGL
jgi:hypothetical protein